MFNEALSRSVYETLDADELHARAVEKLERVQDIQRRLGELTLQNQEGMDEYRLMINIWVEKVNGIVD